MLLTFLGVYLITSNRKEMHEALDTVLMVDDQDELDEIELESSELEDTIGSSSSLHGAARALLVVDEGGGSSAVSSGGPSSSSCSRELATSSSRVDELSLSSRPVGAVTPTSPARASPGSMRSEAAAAPAGLLVGASTRETAAGAQAHLTPAAAQPQPPASGAAATTGRTSSASASDAISISSSISALEKQQLIDSASLPPSRSAPSLARRPSREDTAARRDSWEGAAQGAQGAQGVQAVETPQPRARRPSLSAIRDALPSLHSTSCNSQSPPLRPSDARPMTLPPEVAITLPGSGGVDPRESRTARAASALTFGGLVGGSTPSTFLYDPAAHHAEDKEYSKELEAAHAHAHAQAGGGGQGGGQGGTRSPTCSSGERKGREATAGDGVSTSDKYKERIARARRRTADRFQGVLPLTSPHALLSMDSEREDSPAYSQREPRETAEGADMPPTDAAASASPGSEADARRAGKLAASGVGWEVTAIADERL